MTETKDIKLDDVTVVGNFRRHFDETKLTELAESIRKVGVLEPILVRESPAKLEGSSRVLYLLIAGERRLRAARGAGLKTVPARIMNVDEKGAAEIQLLENLHREDLGYLDEANAFKVLLEGGKHTPESLAERVDKSVAYVYRSLRLLDLPDNALAAIQEGVLTPAHGHQILRAPAEKREELTAFALEQGKARAFPAWELRNHIEYRYSADLADACFPKWKAYAGEVACNVCPFNSGNQGQLFDGAEKGKCSNPDCFKKKTGTFLEEYSKASAADYPGLQYLGVQSTDYSGGLEGIKRALVMGGTLPREVSKVVKEKPEKFGWCVISPRGRGEKPTTAMVCLDKKVLATAQETSGNAMGRAVRGADSREQEREDFINEAVQRALQDALAETVEPRSRFDFTPAQWAVVVEALNTQDQPFEVTGKTDRSLAQDLLVRAALYGPDIMAACKALGVNHDRVSASATKAAEKEWVRIQSETKADRAA